MPFYIRLEHLQILISELGLSRWFSDKESVCDAGATGD